MNRHLRIPFDQADWTPATDELKSPKRILVVDDESMIRWFSTEVLLHSGYQVDAAENGADGWEALRLNSYDLLITDNNMCRLTGLGLVKKLRAARMTLPVIMVSGAMPAEELKQQPWLQISATLAKPFTTVKLLSAVEQVFDSLDKTCGERPDFHLAPSPQALEGASLAIV